jgi:hypothetical protein
LLDNPRAVRLAAIAAAVVVALCALWFAGDTRYRTCIEKAQAEFPAVPVSAFEVSRRDVGPLKVSFVKERAKAVDDCSRFF